MNRLVRVGGFAAFLLSLGATGWWWTGTASLLRPAHVWPAAVLDAALFTLFALHHSVLARPWAKAVVARALPVPLGRSAYVWVASGLLTALVVAWQPVGGLLYHATGGVARFLQVVQLAGVVVGVLSVRRISVSELGGLTDAVPDAPLEAGGPYALVRHPVYVSLVLLLGGTTTMTGDRLLFASLALLYIVVAIPFEEAGLARAFGPQYDAYRHRVRWRLIPYIY